MTARIFFKLIFAVLLIMVVALTAVDFLASEMAESAYVQGLTVEMQDKMKMLGVLGRQNILQLTNENVRAMAVAAGGRLTVIAPDGRVLLDSEAEPAKMENHGDRPEVRAALAGRLETAIRRSPTLGVNSLYVAGPVREGAARLALPLREVRSQVTEIRRKLLIYMALAFLPAILLAAFFARYFSARLGAIIDYASTLATGNFNTRLERVGNDELGTLGRQLNETGDKLRLMFEELQHEHVEMEKLERVRKDFVINVSHELRTPLASIQGYTETLLDGAIHDSDHNIRFLNIIRQNAERLGRLTADLLTLSRIELKSQRFQFASYYLNSLLQDCVDSLQPVADKKNISLDLHRGDPTREVFCDSEAVHQMMSNLLDNAIKYTPEGGHITVSTEELPDGMRVRVQDTGIGIPKEELPRLFERFYRVDKARSREMGGTGLGLAIVKHMAKAQGGEVGVESLPDQGSTFWFTLPAHDLGLGEEGAV
ncbi:MAG: HAMP domain-containing protein [Bryobacterales bacterium]|nr:HAMP domain-containing protein [Bryobacterales bacterium]